jgi:putative nucleotidyltransferase with HDIG domain
VAGLIKQADLAMYRAKQTRNAVCRVRVLPPVPRVSTTPEGDVPAHPKQRRTGTPRAAAVVLSIVVAAGFVAAVVSAGLVWRTGHWMTLLPFLLLAGGAECIKERVFEARDEKITMSFAIAVTMAAITVVPAGAALVSLTAAAVHVLFIQKQRKPDKVLFNLANPALSAAASSAFFMLVHPAGNALELRYLAAACVAVLTFNAVNFGLINVMISVHTRRPLLKLLAESSWYTPTKFFLGLTGAFLGSVYSLLGVIGVVMFVAPLMILRYTAGLHAEQSESTIAQLKAAKAEVEQAHLRKEETLRQLIVTVANMIDARDHLVLGHSQRVARYAVALGQEMGLTPGELAVVETAGLLHDMGKIAVPEAILNKPARLTPEEYAVVQEHAGVGERILSEVAPLDAVARIVGEHHERWDGAGYPRGRAAGEISLAGRVMAVADSLDTILSDRPYAPSRDFAWALGEIERCAGTQFDPDVVQALQRVVAEKGPEFFGKPKPATDPLAELVS